MPICFGVTTEAGLLESKPTSSSGLSGLMTLDNLPNRMTLRRRCIFQVSDLSSVDGE
jgi:hypothetical protein